MIMCLSSHHILIVYYGVEFVPCCCAGKISFLSMQPDMWSCCELCCRNHKESNQLNPENDHTFCSLSLFLTPIVFLLCLFRSCPLSISSERSKRSVGVVVLSLPPFFCHNLLLPKGHIQTSHAI